MHWCCAAVDEGGDIGSAPAFIIDVNLQLSQGAAAAVTSDGFVACCVVELEAVRSIHHLNELVDLEWCDLGVANAAAIGEVGVEVLPAHGHKRTAGE